MYSGLVCAIVVLATLLGAVSGQVMPTNTAVIVGGTVTLQCQSTGATKFQWYRDGQRITNKGLVKSVVDATRFSLTGDPSNGDNHLTIIEASVAASDGGHYECRFTISGTKTTYKAELIVIDDPLVCLPEFFDPEGTQRESAEDIEPGDTMTLTCTLALSGHWAPEITCTEIGFQMVGNTNYSSINLASHVLQYSVHNGISGASVTCTADFATWTFPGNGVESGRTVEYDTTVPTYTSTATVDEGSITEVLEEEEEKGSASMPEWLLFMLVGLIVAAAVAMVIGIVCACKSSKD